MTRLLPALLLAALVCVAGCWADGTFVQNCFVECGSHGGVSRLFCDETCHCEDGLVVKRFPEAKP